MIIYKKSTQRVLSFSFFRYICKDIALLTTFFNNQINKKHENNP